MNYVSSFQDSSSKTSSFHPVSELMRIFLTATTTTTLFTTISVLYLKMIRYFCSFLFLLTHLFLQTPEMITQREEDAGCVGWGWIGYPATTEADIHMSSSLKYLVLNGATRNIYIPRLTDHSTKRPGTNETNLS